MVEKPEIYVYICFCNKFQVKVYIGKKLRFLKLWNNNNNNRTSQRCGKFNQFLNARKNM